MKRKEAVKINDAFTRVLTKMSQGQIVDVPEGTMFKAGKGIAISDNDYNTLYPFLWAAVKKGIPSVGWSLNMGCMYAKGSYLPMIVYMFASQIRKAWNLQRHTWIYI